MHPVVKDELLRDDHLMRLERCCQLVSHTPVRRFEDVRPDVQVLITSWGCPRIDRDAISAVPQLKLIAHLAGWQWKTLASMRTAIAGGEYPPTPWPDEFNDPESWEEDGDVESVNRWIHDDAEPTPAAEIMARFLQQWREIREIIAGLDEAQLNDPNLFPRLQGRSIGEVLSQDALSGHTEEHLQDDVDPWLERNRRRRQ